MNGELYSSPLGRYARDMTEQRSNAVSAATVIRRRIRGLLCSVRTLFARDVDNPEERECARRAAVVSALQGYFGPCLLHALRESSVRERQTLLDRISEVASGALGIDTVPVLVRTTEPGMGGGYDAENNVMVVCIRDVERNPLDDDDAMELLDTVVHGLYHAFQFAAMNDPVPHGVSKAQAREWRRNFATYVSFRQNQRLYWMQPVEVAARCFAHAVALEF